MRQTVYTKYIKRILDIVIAGIAILLASPFYIIIIILELFFHGNPIFYASQRPGKDGVLFDLYKFRSMTNKRDSRGELLPENERITIFGRILRRTSLDEIPEFINIIKGDMSIIGPRPLLVEYMDKYSERHSYRHAVRPGLVCVKIKRDNKPWTWGEQFENDIWYIENISFKVDLLMVFRLVQEMLNGSKERTDGSREKFTGDNLW